VAGIPAAAVVRASFQTAHSWSRALCSNHENNQIVPSIAESPLVLVFTCVVKFVEFVWFLSRDVWPCRRLLYVKSFEVLEFQ